jgi:hypothetical protein
VLWPSPEAATVTLDLSECRLILPERRVAAEIDPQAPGPARPPGPSMFEALTEQASETAVRVAADGTHLHETFDDFGAHRIREHGLETGHSVRQVYAIRPGDPLSARHRVQWRWRFARGDWRVSFATDVEMTCDVRSFFLKRRVTAWEDDAIAIDRVWEEAIPRGFH